MYEDDIARLRDNLDRAKKMLARSEAKLQKSGDTFYLRKIDQYAEEINELSIAIEALETGDLSALPKLGDQHILPGGKVI